MDFAPSQNHSISSIPPTFSSYFREKAAHFLGGIALLGLLFLMGCAPTYQQARTFEQQKQWNAAVQTYQAVAQQAQNPNALQAQNAVVRMLFQKAKWSALLEQISRLSSFLDPEDDWFLRFRDQANVLTPSKRQMEQTLLACGKQAHEQAQKLGTTTAYIVAGRCYGVYLQHFPRGSQRPQAALIRGRVLAIRNACRQALPLFRIASRESKKRPIQTTAFRGLVGCHFKLWQAHQIRIEKQAKGDNRPPKPDKQASFRSIEESASQLLELAPKQGPTWLLQQALENQRSGFYAGTLRLLLWLTRKVPNHPLSPTIQKYALQVFGQTERWGPLLPLVQSYLAPTSLQERGTFEQRLTLLVLKGLQNTKQLKNQRQWGEVAKRYLAVSKLAPNVKDATYALYQAALAFEEAGQLSQAETLYVRITEKHAKHRLAPMAFYRYAVLLRDRKDDSSTEAFETLAKRYPKSMIASRAWYEAYLLHRKKGANARARAIRKQILRRYPTSMEARRFRQRRR